MNVEKVSIIIPVYNRTQDVKRLLHQLAQQSTTQFEVIVIDDCSHDPVEPALAREVYPFAWKCIRHEKNCGVGKARNTGIAEATGEVLVFVDSDAEIRSQDWYEKHMEGFKQAARTSQEKGMKYFVFHSAVCGMHATVAGQVDTYSNWFASGKNHSHQIINSHAPMNNTSMPRKVFDKVGLFDEELHLCEDVEWCLRCHEAEIPLFFIPGAEIGHHDRNKWKEVFAHYYYLGRYAPVVRRKHPDARHSWLFPQNRYQAILLFFPLTILLTGYIVVQWVRHSPKVLFYSPGIYLANVAWYIGIYTSVSKGSD